MATFFTTPKCLQMLAWPNISKKKFFWKIIHYPYAQQTTIQKGICGFSVQILAHKHLTSNTRRKKRKKYGKFRLKQQSLFIQRHIKYPYSACTQKWNRYNTLVKSHIKRDPLVEPQICVWLQGKVFVFEFCSFVFTKSREIWNAENKSKVQKRKKIFAWQNFNGNINFKIWIHGTVYIIIMRQFTYAT